VILITNLLNVSQSQPQPPSLNSQYRLKHHYIAVHYIQEIRNTFICISGIRFIITYNVIQCFSIAHREFGHVTHQVLNGVNPCRIYIFEFHLSRKKEKHTSKRETVTFS